MALIISQAGRTMRLERSSFENEAALQAYIYACPEAIPLDELEEGATLHVLGREFPTASGPVDALGTDRAGSAYLIETKLYANPDKRRVIAQVLDYGAALWAEPPEADALLAALQADASRRESGDCLARLARFLQADEEAAASHLGQVRSALAEGRFTAVILMDRLEPRLRNLISFINEKSTFRVIAVELDYYRHQDTQIVSPRLYGAEARAGRHRGAGETRRTWDEASFFARLNERAPSEVAGAVRALYEFAKGRGEIVWGSGVVDGSFSPRLLRGTQRAPISVYTDGTIDFKPSWIQDSPDAPAFVASLAPRLTALGLPVGDLTAGKVKWPGDVWGRHVQELLDALRASLPPAGGA